MEEEIRAIPSLMSFFSLSAPMEMVPVKEGISNHNYRVKAAEGEFIVKFLIHQSVEQVENDIAIQRQLQRGGIEAPVYLQSEGGAYIYQIGNLKAVSSRKIEGITPRNVSPQLAEAFGRTLARFHHCVTHLPHPNVRGLLNPAVSDIQSDVFAQVLPRGVIHGDFHPGNVLVDSHQNTITAILDFEDAGENLFLVDLAVTILGVCFAADDGTMNAALVQAAINGYQSIRALTHAEQTWFPLAVQYAADTWIKWFTDRGYERYAAQHQERLHRFREIDVARLFASSNG